VRQTKRPEARDQLKAVPIAHTERPCGLGSKREILKRSWRSEPGGMKLENGYTCKQAAKK
jgi:hypothetical protein